MKKAIALLLFSFSFYANAQSTIGVTQYMYPNTDGYILFAPMTNTATYLIDKCGREINHWNSSFRPALGTTLTANGELVRTGISNTTFFGGTGGGKGGVFEKYDWSGNLLWQYIISDSLQCQHHDFKVLPNGNILAIVWELRASADAIANGKNPTTVASLTLPEIWSEKVVEIQPGAGNSGTIVWEWKVWDHLIQDIDASKANYGVVNQHPELFNINYVHGPPTSSDWIHLNSIDYNGQYDQILLSSHNFEEVWIIDHSTSTAQAASHSGGNSNKGGDLLYRWGNPLTYGRGVAADKKLFGQHHASWIPQGYPNAGKILIFNNGANRPAGAYTSVDMIDPPIAGNNLYTIGTSTAYGPSALTWTYTAPIPTDFYASNIGGVFPLSHGSFMITNGPSGIFFEIDSTSAMVWKYVNPVNQTGPLTQGASATGNLVFRTDFYSPAYSGFAGQTLNPGNEIELNPTTPSLCSLATTIENKTSDETILVFPNPTNGTFTVNLDASFNEPIKIEMLNGIGQLVFAKEYKQGENKISISESDMETGIYLLKISSSSKTFTKKLFID